LEIGAGCGAITGALCDSLEKVVAVELSKRRATINYERHKNRDNLEIIVANLNNIEFCEKFDYITLNGVLSMLVFYKNRQPLRRFFKTDKKHLKQMES